jgi:hypothetical protein
VSQPSAVVDAARARDVPADPLRFVELLAHRSEIGDPAGVKGAQTQFHHAADRVGAENSTGPSTSRSRSAGEFG